jgi:hypothetical protein
MRRFLRPSLLTLVLGLFACPLLDGHCNAQGFASAQATAQSGLMQAPLAAPQAVLSAPQAAYDTYDTCAAPVAALAAPACSYQAAALQAAPVAYQDYAPVQQVVVQRQIVAAPVYVQRQIVQQALVSPYVVRQQAVVGYGVQNQVLAQANVGYGAVAVNRGLVANRGLIAGRQRAQRTVSKSRAVTRTGRPGLVNRVLGR